MDKITAAEIARITGRHKSSIIRRANKEKWKYERVKNRILYITESLPEDIREVISGPEEGTHNNANNNQPHHENAESTVPIGSTDSQSKEQKIIEELKKGSVILLGKQGIGKTYTLQRVVQALNKEKVIFFTEPPTAKTILLNLKMAAGIEKPTETKQEMLDTLRDYRGDRIILAIDRLEEMTPSAIEVLGTLMEFSWFRFLGAGHLGRKKKYNSVWMKAKGIFIKPLSRQESRELIEAIWPEGDSSSKRIIIDRSRGIPKEIVKMASEAKQGIMPEEEERFFDFTPVILVIATAGLAVRVIGYGYQSAESYIIGGIIAAVFWGIFWIYRGYVAGWWGSKKK